MLTGLFLVMKNFTVELDYVFYGEKIRTYIDSQDNERVFKYFHRNKWHQINNSNDKPIDYVYYSPHFNKYFSNEPSKALFIFRVIGIIFFLLMSLRVIKLVNNGKNLDSLFLAPLQPTNE